ncbi:MAG: M48 family metalloprotease [Gammaproteobacteria bacterium]|jgi:predicted Zn-dependent protease|nr:M48 family metalloprotease [Gammaproteobacteria bacterium]
MRATLKLFTLLLACVALASTLPGCAANPATGGADVVLSSRDGEKSIGSELHEKMAGEGLIYADPQLQAYIESVGQRLVRNSDMPDAQFQFFVVDSPDINAFAVAGGYIYIHRGLLAYLDSEAELAGVLGHEIGHITARHSGRQRTASVTNSVLAATVYILTGSGDLADASNIYGAELLSGYGREMELEADALGARYMHRSGYDPEALLEVIGVLKNHQQYQRLQARAAGRERATYHGLFATHPRNDKRLRTVIQAASELDLDTYIEDPTIPGQFKRHIDGMVWGDSIRGERAENRFYHNTLDFTFELPPGWSVETTASDITARAPDNSARVVLTLRARDREYSPRALLQGNARGELSKESKLELAEIEGYTAVATSGERSKRLAVIDHGSFSYLLEGEAAQFESADPQLLAIIESFRPIFASEKKVGQGQFIRYIQVPRGATMASIAAQLSIPDAENQIRLINGFYPRGEPRTGDWIKIIE